MHDLPELQLHARTSRSLGTKLRLLSVYSFTCSPCVHVNFFWVLWFPPKNILAQESSQCCVLVSYLAWIAPDPP